MHYSTSYNLNFNAFNIFLHEYVCTAGQIKGAAAASPYETSSQSSIKDSRADNNTAVEEVNENGRPGDALFFSGKCTTTHTCSCLLNTQVFVDC